ncbi:MAG TPA: lysophospholipid acyltransferase family protein [Longimicrobiales bacterium]
MIGRRIASVLLWLAISLLVIVWTFVVGVAFLLTAWRDPGRYTAGLVFRMAPKIAIAINPLWNFRTTGVRIDDPRRPYVVVSNHESYADVFLISMLPWEMKWLSKDAIFRVPFQGWMMRMAGDVEVVRSDPNSRARAIEGLRDRLRKRVSVMIFPEGTRSPTDEMLPFRDGAFRLAIEEGVPVLPLVVAGTRDAMAKHSFVFNRARAAVKVLEPIPTAGMTADDSSALRERVRGVIADARTQLRAELAERG